MELAGRVNSAVAALRRCGACSPSARRGKGRGVSGEQRGAWWECLRRIYANSEATHGLPETISADYTLRPSELTEILAVPVQAHQPCMVWGGPGCGKSQGLEPGRQPLGLPLPGRPRPLLNPVDLRGIL